MVCYDWMIDLLVTQVVKSLSLFNFELMIFFSITQNNEY